MPQAPQKIGDLFPDIDRTIEEVIKVDDLRDETLLEEIAEYYPTPSIQEQMAQVLKAYDSVRQGSTSKIGVWVSGFFGAGKSSFAKLLGILVECRRIGTQDAIDLFAKRIKNPEIKVFLQQIREHVPTLTVVFDILKDQIQSAKDNPVTLVMYKALLRALGYPQDVDLAELEINLEQRGELDGFRAKYVELFPGRTWDDGKRLVMTAVAEASRTLHELDAQTYPSIDYWARTRTRVDLSPKLLAERVLQLSQARADGRNVVFVVDEVGQYVARDLARIGDLQGVVESFAMIGKGKIWLVATSQEKLDQILDIYEKDRSDLVRLQDRFAHKVFLNPSDIREVASHRVLSKTSAADKLLRKIYGDHKGKLTDATRITGSVQLPPLEEDSFVSLYPLLPYQVDLMIDVVSGLRRQGGGPQTMGGANRTIIKLSHELLVNEKVGLASKSVGVLVTFDNVYELISTNVATEIQQEIDDIQHHVTHPFAAPVAKALALLQFAEAVHTTEENLAAVLHPGVAADSILPKVREAVEKLIEARKIRRSEHGLKIQSAAERTWDQERDSRRPPGGARTKIIKDVLEQIWGKGTQAPSQQLGGWKRFSAGLRAGSEVLIDGDVPFEVCVLDASRPKNDQIQEIRSATQQGSHLVTWGIELSDDAERHIVERYRSEQMLSRPVRGKEEELLQRDEKRRLNDASSALATELRHALCRGRIFFQGNDRSPSDDADDAKAEARRVLGGALTTIFHRFEMGNVKVTPKDVEAILKSESVTGLPSCYAELALVQTVDGQARLVTSHGAASEIFGWIRLRCEDSQAPSGKELEQHFSGPPYGWDFDLIRLVVATLLRDGQITLTAQSQQIKSALTPEAQREITNNPRFRALTVRMPESKPDPKKIRAAAKALEQRLGHKCPALTTESVAATLREKLCAEGRAVETALDHLKEQQLPGIEALTQAVGALRLIRDGDDEQAITAFLDSADTLAKGIPRARSIEQAFTGGARQDLRRAHAALQSAASALDELEDADPARQALGHLRDRMEKETFYEEIPAISSEATAVFEKFGEVYDAAFRARRDAYSRALQTLAATAGWSDLRGEEQDEMAHVIRLRANEEPQDEAWRSGGQVITLLREQTQAAPALLDAALAKLRRAITPEAVEIRVRDLLGGPIRTAEELESALSAIREAIEKAIADGRAVVLV